MNVLLLGSGAREHALAWKMSQSKRAKKVFVAPGNDGMMLTPKIETVPCNPCDKSEVYQLVQQKDINLVVVGPEKPLAEGIVDFLKEKNITVFGPDSYAAQLESSKIFSKHFMQENSIPTARFEEFESFDDAIKSLENWDFNKGVVIKADELAGGKGVVVTKDKEVAKQTLYDFMQNPTCTVKTKKVLIEEMLIGQELSAFAICDGNSFINFGYDCDYKRDYNNDLGPNT